MKQLTIDGIRINGTADEYQKAIIILSKLGFNDFGIPEDGFNLLVYNKSGKWLGQSHLLSVNLISLNTLELILKDFYNGTPAMGWEDFLSQ